jgi:hypothetical protein
MRASWSGLPDPDARINRDPAPGLRFVPVWRPASAHRTRRTPVASRQSPERSHHKIRGRTVTTPVHDADTHLIPESTTSSPSNERDRPGREVPAILIPCPGDCTMSCSTVPTQPLSLGSTPSFSASRSPTRAKTGSSSPLTTKPQAWRFSGPQTTVRPPGRTPPCLSSSTWTSWSKTWLQPSPRYWALEREDSPARTSTPTQPAIPSASSRDRGGRHRSQTTEARAKRRRHGAMRADHELA